MNNIIKAFILVLIFVVIGFFVVVSLNYQYITRVYSAPDADLVHQVDWFEPVATVSGNTTINNFAFSTDSLNTQEQQFKESISYAQKMGTSTLLVYQNDEIVLNKAWKTESSTTSKQGYVQTYSVHKSIVALTIGVAIDEGLVSSVHDPVSKYLGQYIEMPYGQITIEHLLTMASGLELPPVDIENSLLSHSTQLMYGSDISKVARSLPQVTAPGTVFEYNNSNPQLLIDVIQAATGRSYSDYLQDKIWSKIAAYPSYTWLDKENGTAHGFCCLIAKPEDLLRVGLLILNQGQAEGQQVLSQAWINATTTGSKTNPNYGYLTWLGSPYKAMRTYRPGAKFGVLHSAPYTADDLIFFDGFGGQRVYIVPSQKLVIVRVGQARFDFDDAILPNSIMAVLEREANTKKDETPKHIESDIRYADITIGAAHSETIPLRVSFLAQAKPSYPLVVFSHGHFLTNDAYHHLTDHWVNLGYVVIAPQHIDTGEMAYVQKLTEEVGGDWIGASRVLDMKAVIDQTDAIALQLEGFSGRIQNDKVIAAGHSLGALSAQLLAGAEQEKQGNSIYPIPTVISDKRVVAVVAVSPPGLMKDYASEKTWQNLNTPQLVVTGTKDVFDYIWTDYKEHFVSYESAMPGHNYLLVLEGMDHYLGNLIGRLNKEQAPQRQALDNLAKVSATFMNIYHSKNELVKAQPAMSEFITEYPQQGVVQFLHR